MAAQPNGQADSSAPYNQFTDEIESSEATSQPPKVTRDQWGNKLDFILSCLGYAIGLGNVWRFPYVAYNNGGGVFLVAYCIMIVAAALPVMVLEMLIGQFSNLGCISVWRMCPLFKGIGYAMAAISTYFCLYYNLIIGYTIYYLFASFKNPLPWSHCGNHWNTENCFAVTVNGSNATVGPTGDKPVWAAEEYWERQVLRMTEGIHDLGNIRWELFGCFAAAWVAVYLCIMKGVKSSGKVVYFTAIFPFIVLTILLIRGVTLKGAEKGIIFFIKPVFSNLLEARVWTAAANQVFITFGAGWGGVMTLASYNNYRNNCIRDCIILVVLGACTSITAGFVVFSVLGHMADTAGVNVTDVVQMGPGLTFVAYPMALSLLPLPQFWSVVFFFMLFTLGLDTQFVTLETVITAIIDEMAGKFSWVETRRYLIILGTCIVMCIMGIPLCTQGGLYIETLIDYYSAGFTPLIVALCEVTVVGYVYGWRKFRKDVMHMLGFYPNMYWVGSWLVVSPVLILVVLIVTFVDHKAPNLGSYTFPPLAQAVGWGMLFSSFLIIVLYGVYNIWFLHNGNFRERLWASIRPLPSWGPSQNCHRVEADYDPLPGQGPQVANSVSNTVV